MYLFEWDQRFDVEYEEITQQHKELIRLVNKLSEAMQNNKSREVMSEIIEEVVNYGIYHFDTEEALFDEYDYVNKTEHIAQHTYFKNKAKELVEANQDETFKLSIETLHFLVNWITEHILETDAKYRGLLE